MENYKELFASPKDLMWKEEVARGTRLLNMWGLSQSGESGDCSVRDLETGLMYISGSPDWCFQKNLRDARGWERWVSNKDSEDLVPWSTPTIEWPMHVAIYNAIPEAGAICHTHGVWASVFAALRMDVPLEKAGEGLTGIIPCSDYRPAGSPASAGSLRGQAETWATIWTSWPVCTESARRRTSKRVPAAPVSE